MAVEWDAEDVTNLENVRYTRQLEATVELFQERIAELEFVEEDRGWERLNGGGSYEFSRDFLQRIVSRSRLFFLQNPLINRAVTLQADYVFAQGVSIQGTNEFVNEVIQEFLDDPRNQAEFTAHKARLEKEQTQIVDGNIFFVLFTDKANTGRVQIRSILVDEIKEIVCNPDDANEVWFYKREWTEVQEGTTQPKTKIAYYPDINYMPLQKFRDRKSPGSRNGHPIMWDAPILHSKTGALSKSRFGVPETYSALDWARAHTDQLKDWATIIRMYARYAMKLTVPGSKQSIVAAKSKLESTIGTGTGRLSDTNPAATTGSIFIRNKDGVDIEPIKTSGATTSATDSRQLRLQVAAAMGLPDPMLSGEVDVGNLATAKTLDRPTELKFRSRQQMWTDIYMTILNWVMRWAIQAPNGLLSDKVKFTIDKRGKLVYVPQSDPKTGKPIDLHVEVSFPPILEKTIQDRIDAIVGAVTLNGKSFAVDSPELKKLTIRLMLQALGLKDIDELVEMIFAGMSDDDLKDSEPEVDNGNAPEPTEIQI